MRVSSRMLLVLTLMAAVVGFGVPAHGSRAGSGRAHDGGAVAAGVAHSVTEQTLSNVPVTIMQISPNPTSVGVLTTVVVNTAPNVSCVLSLTLANDSTVQNVAQGSTSGTSTQVSITFTPGSSFVGQDQATVTCSVGGESGIAVATLLVSPFVATPTATPVITPGERVTISPNQPLVPGSVFSILGQGFAPGATITFKGFPYAIPYSVVVQPNGTFVISNIVVPYKQPADTFDIVLLNSANVFDHITVHIVVASLTPIVTMNTPSAAYGDTVAINGSGFGGNEVVDVSLGPDPLLTVKTDNLGNFTGTFTVPSNVPYGTFNVAVRGESTGALGYSPLTVSLVSPFAPTSTPTGTITSTPAPGPPTFTPTVTPVPIGPTQATFYFPEGTSADGTQVTFTVLNVSNTPAHTTVELVFTDGRVSSATYLVPAQSIYQVSGSALIDASEKGQPFSAEVSADQPVAVTRSIVRPGHEGTMSTGTMAIYHYLYFAEGYTAGGFQEQLALFNSVNANAHVELRLLPSTGGPPLIRRYIIGPLRRYTIDVNALLPRRSVGALVISDVELAVERTLTFGQNGNGQTTVAGVDAPATTWYFAEGSTKNGFSEFMTLLNPSSSVANVTADFYDPHGRHIGAKTLAVPPLTRATIDVGTVVQATSVGAIVSSSQPILAERTMYRGSLGSATVIGSGTFGRPALAAAYEFPLGDTSSGNAEFLLLLNPGNSPLAIQARFYTMNAPMVPYTFAVPAHSRLTINVGRDVPVLPPGVHGVVLTSVDGSPFMAEQSEYLQNFTSASSSIGVAAPALAAAVAASASPTLSPTPAH